jgi:hypothetical protein
VIVDSAARDDELPAFGAIFAVALVGAAGFIESNCFIERIIEPNGVRLGGVKIEN